MLMNPNCDNINDWQGSEDIVSPTGQSVAMIKHSDRIRVIQAPDVSDPTAEVISASGVVSEAGQGFEGQNVAAKVISASGTQGKSYSDHVTGSQCKQDNPSVEMVQSGLLPLYDVNYTGVEDKFVNSILHMHQFSTSGDIGVPDSEIYNVWRRQSEFNFGFVPLGDQMLPKIVTVNEAKGKSPIQIHEIVRSSSKPNFMQARIQIHSQLKVEAWKKYLEGYWDQQLCELIQFGFPLDFNSSCILNDIEAYLEEELKYGALLGPFPRHPISAGHCSPFMTRAKPNSDRRQVIVDLSWPPGASVNAGIDKTSYLDSVFSLTFPTVDDITGQFKRLGSDALLYKIDISRTFRHLKVDPGDYDLLGLEWQGACVNTCVPFGTRHGSQIFQRLSDAVRYMMRQKGYAMIDYIDDYVGIGVPSVAWKSYDTLTHLMRELGLTISEKKLVNSSDMFRGTY